MFAGILFVETAEVLAGNGPALGTSTCWMQRAARKFKPKSYNLERHAFSLREFFIAKICYSSSQLSVG